KEIVSAPGFGTIMHAEGNYSHDWLANQPADNWRSAPEETRAGGMTGMGIHLLDSFSFLIGPIRRTSPLPGRRGLPDPSGDTTAALLAFENGATGTIATTLKTPFVWRLAVYGADQWVESRSETQIALGRSGREPEVRHLPQTNHVGLNLES